MDPYTEDYLTKMLPGFEKKPRPQTPPSPPKAAGNQASPANQEQALVPIVDALPPERPAHKLFDSIAAYISRHLACDPHQLTVLTLWVGHTWSFRGSPTAVYLNVCSPEAESGKSTCLMLLRELSSNPSFVTGISAASLMHYLLVDTNRVDDNKFESTLFLDDCQHTFGPAERQPLLALLNSGCDVNPCYLSAGQEYCFFGPKAFASTASLPRSLAARCIPIRLYRRKPSDPLVRFSQDTAREPALKLVIELVSWVSRSRQALDHLRENAPPLIHPGLTPREQSCAEPLLHLADLIGGPWPDRTRLALGAIFKLAESSMGVELLRDIRALFNDKGDPEYISTKDMLAGLVTWEHRPWSNWTRNSGQKLAKLLHPFGITSQGLHCGSETSFKGYLFKDFQDAWERYLPPIPVRSGTKNPAGTNAGRLCTQSLWKAGVYVQMAEFVCKLPLLHQIGMEA